MKNRFLLLLIPFTFSCNSTPTQPKENQNHGRPSVSELINQFDKNKDNQISKEEVSGPLADDFSKIDKNKDGFLTKEELENGPKPNGPNHENSIIDASAIDTTMKVMPVNTSFFIKENIIGEITTEKKVLSGIETLCYVFKTNSQATEHAMGPWCPDHIEEGSEDAGIWFKDGKVYDVSGHFIANLDEFYSDNKWKLYNEDGSTRVTKTKEGCLAAAKPDVEEEYQNYCVECLPEYFSHQVTTYVIPVKPVYLSTTQRFAHGGIGVAFNGVKYDPPAPTHAILAAHTLAPLDDHGGHVNPHGGYHYHAVTGSTKEIKQEDIHSPLLGYVVDGFGIYALKDQNGNIPTDLDECGGHFDEIRGYHYHAGAPGGNQIIKCLHGLPGYTKVKE